MRRFLVTAVAAVSVATPSVAHASTVLSTSDVVSTSSLSDLTTTINATQAQLAQTYCQFAAPKAVSMSAATAVTHATAYLDRHSTRAARQAFAHSPAAATEHRALAAAADAQAAARPTAVLAALLRARRLAPHDPMPDISLAPVLTDLKLPNEALALLTAAAELAPPAHTPWSLPISALIATNRGYALLALRRWSAAAAVLSSAVNAAPLLGEAKLDLAEAELCTKKPKAAARMIFFGVRRSPTVAGDMVQGGDGTPAPTRAGLDVTHGATIVLPTFAYPADMAEGSGMYDDFSTLTTDATHREISLDAQMSQLATQLYNELQHVGPATRRRVNDLMAVAGEAELDPTVKPLDRSRQKLWDESHTYQVQVTGQATDCSGGENLHDAWTKVVAQLDTATRQEISAAYGLATAVGAYVQQPTAHQLIQLQASSAAQSLWVLLLQQASALTQWDAACASSSTPADPVTDPTDRRGNSAKCPSGLAGRSWSVDLGVASVLLDCDSVSLEVATEGWIGAFGSVSHNFRDGSTTIFAGPRATAGAGGGWGPNVSFKDGLYLTFDSSGAIQDVGARVEAGSAIGAGPAGGVGFTGDSMNFTFVGASPIGSAYAH